MNLAELVKPDIQFDPKLLGKSLREMREFLHLSLRELARESGVSHSQILRIESGEFDCFTSSFVRLCGAMGIQFGDLIERCVKPDYGLYSDAIEAELKDAKFPVPDSKEAVKDLVFGGCISAAFLLRAAWPMAVARELDYPTGAIQSKFLNFAEHLEKQPWDGGKRFLLLKELQLKPVATLGRFFGFPSLEDVKEHVAFAKSKDRGHTPAWFPFRRAPSLVQAIAPTGLESLKRDNDLTDASGSSKTIVVRSQLPGLLERLKKATAAPGKKTELAAALKPKVPLESVSRWLAGSREPGGEIALQLDEWATRQGFPKAK